MDKVPPKFRSQNESREMDPSTKFEGNQGQKPPCQADYQSSMIKIEGKMSRHTVSFLIDPGASLSYISPRMVELCQLQTQKFKIPWLVQLATGAKRRVGSKVEDFSVNLADQNIEVNLNVFPLGYYGVLIGMD